MFQWFGGFVDRIFSVIGAFLFAQIPIFMQQYHQQLMARVAELSKIVRKMEDAAQLSGKTLDQYLSKFLENGDLDISRHGQLIHELVLRWQKLSHTATILKESSPFTRPLVYLSQLDIEIAQTTYQGYEFGIPLTIEGGLYALIGLSVGYCVYTCCQKLATFISRPIFGS